MRYVNPIIFLNGEEMAKIFNGEKTAKLGTEKKEKAISELSFGSDGHARRGQD